MYGNNSASSRTNVTTQASLLLFVKASVKIWVKIKILECSFVLEAELLAAESVR